MKTSQKGFDLIEQFEGFRAAPYYCPAGKPTIGFGSTHYNNGKQVEMMDPPITLDQARDLLQTLLDGYENAVNRYVTAELNQNQFDALVSFVYNVGITNFHNSTLVALLNKGDYVGAANQLDRWVHGGGKVLPGLVKRRMAEKDLFLSAD